jgi:hypothetical protein
MVIRHWCTFLRGRQLSSLLAALLLCVLWGWFDACARLVAVLVALRLCRAPLDIFAARTNANAS